MMILFTLVAAFPIGYFVAPRGRAVLAFLVAASFLFTYQTSTLVMEWVMGAKEAFGSNTDQRDMAFSSEPGGYAAINLIALAVGLGLVLLGGWLKARRLAKKDVVSVG